MEEPLIGINCIFPPANSTMNEPSSTKIPPIANRTIESYILKTNTAGYSYLKQAENANPDELDKAFQNHDIVLLIDGILYVSEEHKEIDTKVRQIPINDSTGKKTNKALDLSKLKIVFLSDSAYQKLLDPFINEMIRVREAEQAKIERTRKREEIYWYKEAVKQERIKDETKQRKISDALNESTSTQEVKLTEKINNNKRLNEERAHKVKEFVQNKDRTQIKIIDNHEQVKNEDVNRALGISPNPETLKQFKKRVKLYRLEY